MEIGNEPRNRRPVGVVGKAGSVSIDVNPADEALLKIDGEIDHPVRVLLLL